MKTLKIKKKLNLSKEKISNLSMKNTKGGWVTTLDGITVCGVC